VEPEEDSKDLFELDLDQHSSQDLNEAFEEAVAAVDSADRSESVSEPEGVELDEGSRDFGGPEVERLRSENRALRERLMRTLADFDNFRKRTEREKQSLGRFAIFDVVKDFLPAVDNLERALAASGKLKDLKQGIEMVMKQLEDILQRHGVEDIESINKPFDPSVHQAVTSQETEEVEVPTVLTELQRGYLLYDRLLRPAMVTVGVPLAPPGQSATEEEVDDEGGRGEEEEAQEEVEEFTD
jgi:molecular chaperone GrpE